MTNESNTLVKLFPNEPSAIELFNGDSNMEEYTSPEDMERLDRIRDDSQIQTLAMVLISDIGRRLVELGVDPAEQPHDFFLLSEAVISMVSGHYEHTHPLQELAAATIMIDEENEDEAMTMYKFFPPKMTFMRKDDDDGDC